MQRLKSTKKRLVTVIMISLILVTLLALQIKTRMDKEGVAEDTAEDNIVISEDLRDINWELRDRVWVLSDSLNKAQSTMTELEEDNQRLAKENLRLLKIIEKSGASSK